MNTEVGVIVPTVLGLGIVFSLASYVRDLVHRLRGPGWMSRRCGHQGLAAARGVLGPDPSRDLAGLRSRRSLLVTAAACGALSVYLLVGSWGNYIGWTGWSESIAWLWVCMLAAAGVAAAFATTSVAAARARSRRQASGPLTSAVLARTVLGAVPDRPSIATTVIAHPRHLRHLHRAAPVRPLGPQHVTDMVAVTVRVVAGVWTLIAVSGLGWLTAHGAIPTTPEELDTSIATPAWLVLCGLLVLSALAVYRFEVGGSIALALCAAGLAILSSIQHPAPVAFGLAALFAAPAFLHWLAWQRDHHLHRLLRVAGLTMVLLTGVWSSSHAVYRYYFGPTHDASVAAALPDGPVTWVWVGGTTATSTTVSIRLADVEDRDGRDDRDGRGRRPSQVVLVAVDSDGNEHRGRPSPTDDLGVAKATVDGLEPGTAYRWEVEVDGDRVAAPTGAFRTLPEGPASFVLAVASCARSGSNAAVFDTITELSPLVYLQLGDLHYASIGDDDPDRFQAALDQVLTRPGQAALYRSTSTAYVWDDHDYAANDGDATSPSRPAVGAVYRDWAPSYPLVSDEPTGPIGQSFVAGRVRVVMTDTRSQRTPPGSARGDDQHVLGPEQEAWFVEQLAAAHDAGQIVLWTSGVPWIGADSPGNDTWAGYPDARRRVADAVVAADMQDRIVLLAGDAHMVALDDGTNTDYSTSQAGGFPLLQAAALDRPGSVKGGPYSDGVFPGGGQFGVVEVRDDGGDTIEVTLDGRTWDGRTLVTRTFTLPLPVLGPVSGQ